MIRAQRAVSRETLRPSEESGPPAAASGTPLLALLTGLIVVLLSGCAGAGATGYDIVIEGGRVIDPASGLDGVRNVGIRGDSVAAVTEEDLEGRRVIDASGLVVAPGFVDILASHPNTDEAARYKVFDGVTTLVSMHGGPVDVEEWYRARRDSGAYLNFGTTVGHNSLRESVGLTDRYAPATAEQIEQMERLAREALDAGAVGIGFGIMYVPGASREEVFRLLQVAAGQRVPAHAHTRYFGAVSADNSGVAGAQELIAAAASTGARAQVVHINSMIAPLPQMRTALAMIEGAREQGIDVMADAYPYTASSTGLSTTAFDSGWQERYGGISYGDVELVSTGERLTEESFERYRAMDTVSVVIHYMPEASVDSALAHAAVMVASDGVIEDGRGHPRGAGTFARVLGRYVRERGVLTLPEAVRKMSFMPARRLEEAVPAMARRGRLSVGAAADVVVFDPESVVDRATFADPDRRSRGVRWLLVAGEPVIDGGELRDGVRPGRGIRSGG